MSEDEVVDYDNMSVEELVAVYNNEVLKLEKLREIEEERRKLCQKTDY